MSVIKYQSEREDLTVTGPVSKDNKEKQKSAGSDYVPDTATHSSSKTPQNAPARGAGAAASSEEADGRKETPREAPAVVDEWYGSSAGPRAPLPANVSGAHVVNSSSSDKDIDGASEASAEGGTASAKPSRRFEPTYRSS